MPVLIGSLFKNGNALMDRCVAYGVDAHGNAFFGGAQHDVAHLGRRDGGVAVIVGEARVLIGLQKPGGVGAGDAVEELLDARRTQHGAGELCLELFNAVEVAVQRQRGKQVAAHGELP